MANDSSIKLGPIITRISSEWNNKENLVEIVNPVSCVKKKETDRKTYSQHFDKTKENAFLKLSGLVWSATEAEIFNFLADCEVMEVVITNNEWGKPTGDAFVRLESKADVEAAMAHNRKYLGARYVVIEEIEESMFRQETKQENMEFIEEIDDGKTIFSFEIKPFDDVSNEEDVLEDCKQLELDGVIWNQGQTVQVSANKSKIRLGCTVENHSNTDAEAIKKKLEEVKAVEDVTIIQ